MAFGLCRNIYMTLPWPVHWDLLFLLRHDTEPAEVSGSGPVTKETGEASGEAGEGPNCARGRAQAAAAEHEGR